jgi:hypothetical protein
MSSTGTASARESTTAAVANSDHDKLSAKRTVPARVRDGAHWFFWIVGLGTMNSLFVILGSHIHRFTGFGVTAVIDHFGRAGSSGAIAVISTGWLAAGFLLLGCCAAEGEKWAFAAGMAVYAVDGALLVAVGDYVSAAVHVVMLYGIYRGFAVLCQPSDAGHSEVGAAAAREG